MMWQRIIRVVHVVEEGLVALLVAGIIVGMIAQVFWRYVLGSPLIWPEQFAKICFVWASFLGASIGARKNAHVRIEEFVNKLPSRSKGLVSIAIHAMIITILAVLLVSGIIIVSKTHTSYLPGIFLPLYCLYLPVPLAASRMLVTYTGFLYQEIRAILTGSTGGEIAL
jgi:TRAP-type C4-dicarboxylate transport system permease small subunit